MGIHGDGDVCDFPQVAIDEFTQADIIVHGTAPTASANEELKLGDAEGVLHVNQ